MIQKVLLGVVLVVALLAAIVASRPSELKVSRATTVAAPAELVYGRIADFHGWADWSPWDELDPNLKRTYDGAPSGKGAIYHWAGNDAVGEGRMTILAAEAPRQIEIKLEFLAPFEATNTTRFELAPAGAGTTVTWTLEGRKNFLTKAFSLVADMEGQVGADFEKGLGKLKSKAEALARDEAERKAREAAAAAVPPPDAALPPPEAVPPPAGASP